ncbi:DUF2235 domain-containing protein [Phaeobacter sp. J2-8]|uniref:DUF2235 domain-containing protein n=1 Tax=Phaeobacter sp. J2-8 TaxID=2931394 RepID=UPI001FD2DAA4|nr:DUF2235 domain-containing protein [Phaeobacter sp. J2-8]MCJ7872594.1 DUF2235 domain-containing protein [Phaeobacter sp. J2-8]
MRLRRLHKQVAGWLARKLRFKQTRTGPRRGQRTHVILLDGTMSSLRDGQETNIGLIYKLLCDAPGDLSLYYEPGVQFPDWRAAYAVMTGKGINRQIRRAYGYLASRYRPGDRIFLIGYSRGAYAVRSLAGLIDRVGLVTARHSLERNVSQAWRHYETAPESDTARAFRAAYCHDTAPIEMVGVFDTVKALGLRFPVFWRMSGDRHAFHNHHLGATVRHGFHALAYDERRAAYAPVLWTVPEGWTGGVEQIWFRGSHGDIGGQLGGFEAARPLSNIPLVWMLGKAEGCGLMLPDGWRARFPTDPNAPSTGGWRGWSKLFVFRTGRRRMTDPSERLHPTLQDHLDRAEGNFARLMAVSREMTSAVMRRNL